MPVEEPEVFEGETGDVVIVGEEGPEELALLLETSRDADEGAGDGPEGGVVEVVFRRSGWLLVVGWISGFVIGTVMFH